MISSPRYVAMAVVFTVASPVWAYEVPTHEELTTGSVNASEMADNASIAWHVGLPPTWREIRLPDGEGKPRPIASLENDEGLIRFGSAAEDATPFAAKPVRGETARPLNHFFDPANDRALEIGGARIPGANKSPLWMLEDTEEVDSQALSLRDASDALYAGLTSTDRVVRREKLGLFFRSVGHVLHHIQDMAQPEHVRNDQHLKADLLGFINSLEGFAVIGDPSLYESQTNRKVEREKLIPKLPIYAQDVAFDTARGFWTGDKAGPRAGLAEFTNFNFVSEDTNFLMRDGSMLVGDYAEPTPNSAAGGEIPFTDPGIFGAEQGEQKCEALKDQLRFEGKSVPEDCHMSFIAVTVNDDYTGQVFTNKKASALSFFDKYMQSFNVEVTWEGGPDDTATVDRALVLNEATYDAARELLLPRAIAYGAGMIDHILRGRLEVRPPDDGAYSVVDHATATGFETIRLRLRESTRGDEAFSGGTVVARASYHRNPCYEPDLSGEYRRDGTVEDCPNPRSEKRSYAKSEVIEGVTLTDTEKSFEFDFSADPIPMSATDVRLQIVYKGAIGEEQGRIAVTRKDIAEPTYVTVFNSTDRVLVGGEYHTAEALRSEDPMRSSIDGDGDGEADVLIDPAPIKVLIHKQGESGFERLATVERLEPARFARLAILGDGVSEPRVDMTFQADRTVPLVFEALSERVNGELSFWPAFGNDASSVFKQHYPVDDGQGSVLPLVSVFNDVRGTLQWESTNFLVNPDGVAAAEGETLPEVQNKLPQQITSLDWE